MRLKSGPVPLLWSKEPPSFCRLKEPDGGDGGRGEEPAAEAEA